MTTWVLLRGLAREARHWESFPSVLSRHLPPGHRVLALDLPGNGERCGEPSPWSVTGMVDAARDELQRRGVRGPCMLVGLSLGGMVALEWAAWAPHEVQGCVLINSSVANLSPFWQRLRPRSYVPLLRSLWPVSAWEREAAVHALTSARSVDPGRVEQWVAYADTRPVRRLNALRQLHAALRFRTPARLPVPGLALASRGDRLVDPECSRAIARAWGLALREHPEAGHDLPLDDPHWVAGQIARWHGGGQHSADR